MSLERSFAEAGRAMDQMVNSIGETISRVAWALRGMFAGQHYLSEASDLAEDVAAERYDIVERSEVRVERDGDHATAFYLGAVDGDVEEITTYDLVEVDKKGASHP